MLFYNSEKPLVGFNHSNLLHFLFFSLQLAIWVPSVSGTGEVAASFLPAEQEVPPGCPGHVTLLGKSLWQSQDFNFFLFFVFLGPHLRYMEVPRLEV